MPDGRRVSIVEASDGSWMRITVFIDRADGPLARPGGDRTSSTVIERGIYDAGTGTFTEWTEVAS